MYASEHRYHPVLYWHKERQQGMVCGVQVHPRPGVSSCLWVQWTGYFHGFIGHGKAWDPGRL